MADDNKNNIKNDRRILYVDPNNLDENSLTNVPVNIEDLSIFVELTTNKKSRSIIKDGTQSNDNSDDFAVNFISGSQFGDKKCDKSLTTSYTDINDRFNVSDELEGFGIESIDISFDTAYTPLVKIKFIDVRGGMMSKGNDSKYGVFFNLPYPIFSLKVKGYYGKAVNYCLHLTKWSGKFNSQTGNFEIDAEFIGYTYAMLTDLLLGYMRAIPYTKIGGEVFNQVKSEYDKKTGDISNGNALITIDDMLDTISKLKAQLPTIKNNSDSFNQVKDIDNDTKIIRQIKAVHDNFIKLLNDAGNQNNRLQGDESYSIILSQDGVQELINERNDDIKDLISNLNDKGSIEDFYNKIIITDKLEYDKFSDLNKNSVKYLYSASTSSNTKYVENENRLTNIIKKIQDVKDPDKYKNGFFVYDYIRFIENLNIQLTNIDSQRKKRLNEFSNDLRNISRSKFNFDPTIKNIFRILIGGAETYIRTISVVSDRAENDVTRISELSKLITDRNLNVKDFSDIYAFPEYNQNNEETWLGSVVDDEKVIEVKFTNDLLDALIEVEARSDDINALLNVNSDWFCTNTIDTPMVNKDTKLVQNPYRDLIGPNEHPHSVLRLLMYRMYLNMAFGTTPKGVDDDIIKYMAKLEANNMFYGVIKQETRQAIYENFCSLDKMLNHFKEGSNEIPNWTGKPSDSSFKKIPYIVEKPGRVFEYKYISKPVTDNGQETFRQYIPINSYYDGKIFYNDTISSSLKTPEELRNQAEIDGKLLYVSNFINGNTEIYSGDTINPSAEKKDDGARYIEIIKLEDYEAYRFNLPTELATKTIDDYRKSIPETSELKQNSIATKTETLSKLDPLKTKFYVPYFNTNVKPDGVSDSEKIKDVGGINDISQVFYCDTNSGTRFSKVDGNELTNTGQNMRLYSSSLNENSNVVITQAQYYMTTARYRFSDNVNLFDNISNTGESYKPYRVGLFSSPLYYAQNATISNKLWCQGYLFLNTLPLQGVVGDFDNGNLVDTLFGDAEDKYQSTNTLQGLFTKTSAFIKTPALWVAWVGSVLWRYQYYVKQGSDPIVTEATLSGSTTNLVLGLTEYPTPFQLWNNTNESIFTAEDSKAPMYLFPTGAKDGYKRVDKTLLALPESVKDIFITFFINWCDNKFTLLKSRTQVFADNIVPETNDGVAQFDYWQSIFNLVKTFTPINRNDPNNSFIYSNFTGFTLSNGQLVGSTVINGQQTPINLNVPVNQSVDGYVNRLYPIIPFDTIPANTLNWYIYHEEINDSLLNVYKKIINDVCIIANHTPNIWVKYGTGLVNKVKRKPFEIFSQEMNKYLESFTEEYKRLYDENATKKRDSGEIKNNLFNTRNNEFIKLNIYRHLSTIKNKWIGENDSDSSMFYPCGYDLNDTLFSRFRFLDKGFNDIGNEFLINPEVVSKLIQTDLNKSFYDLISNILANNNFNFIPLPAFVDFTTKDGLDDIFRPKSYIDYVTNSNNQTIGPAFICVYVGQTSEHLDIAKSDYPDDGVISLNPDCDRFTKNEQFNTTDLNVANRVPVFEVNYAQLNQNYFKDINLDQREFVETSESLVIIDELSRTGKDNKAPFLSQNLFNVYQTRSYSAQIEAMGMPLIQPMMYFQLNNIPMFRGAYLIISTEHNIKPNHMTTRFKGVRIKDVNTPLNKEVLSLKDLDLTESGDADALKYDFDNTSSSTSNVKGDSNIYLNNYETIYWYNYKNTITKYQFDNSLFDNQSNTKKNGEFMTYNELFNEIAELTGTDPIILKVFSVIESRVGQDKTVAAGLPNSGGYVGLFQFGSIAAREIYSKLNDYIFNRLSDLSAYEFSSIINYNDKSVVIPTNWTKNRNENNKDKNSFFDDYINTLSAILLAQRNIGTVLGTDTETIRDIYIAHQQGLGGSKIILNNPLTDVNDTSTDTFARTSRNILNNKPQLKPNDIVLTNYGSWVAGWSGVVDKLNEAITGTYTPSLINTPTPNADRLRRTLSELGYGEKGEEISSGGDISADIEKYASAIFRKIKELYPSYGIIVTGGNDIFHQNSATSKHKSGNAIDFIIQRPNGGSIPKPNGWAAAKTNPPAIYNASDGTIIDNVVKIIQGYVVSDLRNLAYLDEYRFPSTYASGPHIHLSYQKGGNSEGDKFITASESALNAGQITEYTV